MKNVITVVLILLMICGVAGCTSSEDKSANSPIIQEVTPELRTHFTKLNAQNDWNGNTTGYDVNSLSVKDLTKISSDRMSLNISIQFYDPKEEKEIKPVIEGYTSSPGSMDNAKVAFVEYWEAIIAKTNNSWQVVSVSKN